MDSAPPIGIDLGTTNSAAAIFDGTTAQIVRSSLGYSTIPSVLTFGRSGERVVGQQAERQMVLRPHDCVYGSKRLLGRAFGPAVKDRFQAHFAYQLVADKHGLVAARICEQTIPLIEVAGLILKEIKESAEGALNKSVSQAVITVPAYFHENQRAFVRRAGQLAGLEVLRILNEPTAAALCFGAGRGETQRVLVFDLGGGTFDVSIVEIAKGTYNVIGVDGDTFLGGLDFDTRLAEIVRGKMSQTLGRNAVLDAVGRARMLVAVRTAKHELSQQPRAKVEIRCLALADEEMVNVDEEVTAEEYVVACDGLLGQMRTVLKRALDRARLQPKDLDEILLVGGQTRMPAVQQLIREMFGREPSKRVHPDEVVAQGAAIVAYSQNRKNAAALRDMLPMPIGTTAADSQFLTLFPRNTPLPTALTFRLKAQPRWAELALPLLQGDGSHVFDNEVIGSIVFSGLTAAEPMERIVNLRLDAEGLLQVHARKPDEQQYQPAQLATDRQPNEMVSELGWAKAQVTVEQGATVAEQPARRPERQRQASAPPRQAAAAPASAAQAAPAPQPAARPSPQNRPAPGRIHGSARVEQQAKPWYKRLFSWFGKG